MSHRDDLRNIEDVLDGAEGSSSRCATCDGTGRIASSCDQYGIAPCPTCRAAEKASEDSR